MTATTPLLNEGTELLDRPDADAGLVRTNLKDLVLANRWLGGHRALAVALGDLLGNTPPGTRLTLLDVGTGAGDLPAYCRRWAARRGIEIRPVGLERVPAAAAVAAATGLATFVASAEAIPMRPGSVDVVLLSQVVHHFHPEFAVEVLSACDALARYGVVVVDLARSRIATAAFRLAAPALGFAAVTVADGLTSIDRGLSVSALSTLLARAGIEGRVRAVAPYRVVATWHTGPKGGNRST